MQEGTVTLALYRSDSSELKTVHFVLSREDAVQVIHESLSINESNKCIALLYLGVKFKASGVMELLSCN